MEFELPTCLACNPVSREVNTLVSQHPASDVSYLRLDLNKNLNLSYKYDVPKVPAVLLFVDGRLVRKFSEFKPEQKEELATAINAELRDLKHSLATKQAAAPQ